MPALLEFQSVSKSLDKQSILKDINLSIEAGEFLTVLGPSGSGKTTLLRLVGGFEQPDNGRIFLDGEDVSHLPPYKRRVNTVFQSYALFPHLDVRANVAFGLRNLGIKHSELQERIASALELVQLAGFEGRFPHQLSGGQQQRVALARALVMRPRVLLLDEPFGALDRKLRKQMQVELRSLQRKLGLTFVFVTHDQEEALSLSDRVALLHRGQLEQVGRPDEIYQFPKTRFAAEFMGVENIFEVLAMSPNGSAVRCRLAGGLELIARKPEEACDEPRFFAIRSTHISLSKQATDEESSNVVKGQLCHQTYLGDRVLCTVEADSRQWLVSLSASRSRDSFEQFAVGEEVFLNWKTLSGVLVS
jgi:spermidine/putrescine transport system ATP-binding protein